MLVGEGDGAGPGGREAPAFPLALGFERIGLLPLRFPLLSLLFVVVIAIGGAFGLQRIKVDDSLSQLFKSDTAEFRQYEDVSRRFPSSEFDVLVVVEGAALLTRPALEKFHDLVTDLQLIDGTRGIISMFSAREPPLDGRPPVALFKDDLPEGEAFADLIDRVKANEVIAGKLLSRDGQLALIVLALEPAMVGTKLGSVVDEIRKTLDADLDGSKLTARLSGVPVMQLEIRNAVERDRLLYNAIGFFAGCVIAAFFFRRVSFTIVAAGPPLLAILIALGTLGWLGFRLNIFLNVMTPLIMVISFSDSMQLTFAARARLIAGESRQEAMRNAVLVVGPACVLTHATACISFAALQFSDSELIRSFGLAGLVATIIALLAVLMLVPLFGVLLLRREAAFAAKARVTDRGVDVLRLFCQWIAVHMVRRPGLYSLVAVIVVAGLAIVYANLDPRYRLADQVPDNEQAVSASQQLDAKLTGANPVDVLVEFPAGKPLYDPETIATIGEIHRAIEDQAGVGNVWSIETLRRWLAERAHLTEIATLKQYVDLLPIYLTQRFVSAKGDAAVVSGRIPDIDASDLLPIVRSLDKALGAVRTKHPGYTIAVTGLSVIAARNSDDMIGRLSRGLTIEIVFVAAFIGLAFRSLVVMLAAIAPAIFPIVAAGTLLWVMGEGLQFASIVALTVSFGLGLSATIHFLNRLRLESRRDEDPGIAVEKATILMGPPLILTSVVLACGLAVMVFSNLPSLRLFGWLSAFAMLMALVADFVILRPTMTYLSLIARRWTGQRAAKR